MDWYVIRGGGISWSYLLAFCLTDAESERKHVFMLMSMTYITMSLQMF